MSGALAEPAGIVTYSSRLAPDRAAAVRKGSAAMSESIQRAVSSAPIPKNTSALVRMERRM